MPRVLKSLLSWLVPSLAYIRGWVASWSDPVGSWASIPEIALEGASWRPLACLYSRIPPVRLPFPSAWLLKKKKALGKISIPVRAGVGVGRYTQNVRLSKGAGPGGVLEWAGLLTLAQKPQATGPATGHGAGHGPWAS